ncbi:hypothetical protein KY339_02600, partial [Candidatus Woesearchaeota archaeon]|nr:hypothetical protein [Candidatus Woesearchaeota archaeon]
TVHCAKDLEKVDPKNQGAVIAGAVGLRKKIELIKLCQQKSIQILSIKNPKEFLEKVEKRINEKKKEKETKQKVKAEKKEKEKKKAEKKPTIEETLTEEEIKEKEKQEKDKLLTQKGAE